MSILNKLFEQETETIGTDVPLMVRELMRKQTETKLQALSCTFARIVAQNNRIEEKLNWLVDEMQSKKKKRKPAKKKEVPETFLMFWKAYPRKQGKADAFKAWIALKPNDLLIRNIMVDLHNRTKTDIQWQNKQYIPLPATYLRGAKWDDEINPIPVKAPTLPKNDADLESWSIEHGYGAAPIGLTYDQFRRHLQSKLNGEMK